MKLTKRHRSGLEHPKSFERGVILMASSKRMMSEYVWMFAKCRLITICQRAAY